jgi:hypothetical protein
MKMSKSLIKISSLLLVVSILIATSGFSIYTHECNCCGSEDISLVDFQTCCEQNEKEHICATGQQLPEACCDEKEKDQQRDHVCSTNHCCTVESDFHKLKNEFEKTKTPSVQKIDLRVYFIQTLETETLIKPILNKLLQIADESPPILLTRDFIIFSHALKIPF